MADEIDVRILNMLSTDNAISQKEMAYKLAISESYLSKKKKELQYKYGYIAKYTIEIAYEKLGYSTNAISFIKLHSISKQKTDKIAENLSNINEAIEVYTAFGKWDIYVRWLCRSPSEVMENLNKVIEASDIEILETTTFGIGYKRVNGPILSSK